jgi:hypothetical protein
MVTASLDLDAARVALGSEGVLTDTYTPTALAGMTVADPATLFAGFDGAAPVLADNGGPVKTVALSPYAGNPAMSAA